MVFWSQEQAEMQLLHKSAVKNALEKLCFDSKSCLIVCISRISESYLCVSWASCRNLINFYPEVIKCKISDADITEHFKKEESKKSNWEFHNKWYHALKLNKL